MVDFSFLGGVFIIGLYDDEINTQQFPIGWETFSYNDIRGYFDCRSRSKDNNKPLPTVVDWEFMRDTYLEVVSIEERRELAEWAVDNSIHWEDDIVPPTLGYSIEPGIPVPPPYYAKFSPGMGRGLFASRDIKEGELGKLVWFCELFCTYDMALHFYKQILTPLPSYPLSPRRHSK